MTTGPRNSSSNNNNNVDNTTTPATSPIHKMEYTGTNNKQDRVESTSNDNNNSHDVEMGYLFLERCSLDIFHGGSSNPSELQQRISSDQWIPIEIPSSTSSTTGVQGKTDAEDDNDDDDVDRDGCCSRCHLVVTSLHYPQQQQQVDNQNERLLLSKLQLYKGGPRFDGTVPDLRSQRMGVDTKRKKKSKLSSSSPSKLHSSSSSYTNCTCPTTRRRRWTTGGGQNNNNQRQYYYGRRKRSDAALLLGLALTCQENGQIKIQSIQIRKLPSRLPVKEDDTTTTVTTTNTTNNIFQQKQNSPQDQDDQQSSQHYQQESSVRMKKNDNIYPSSSTTTTWDVSLVITISFPHLLENNTSGSAGTGGRRIASHSSKKFLPASTQLLLSIIRSDWDVLEEYLQNPSSSSPSTNNTEDHRSNSRMIPPIPMFPSELSLEEVYKRISAAGSSFLSSSSSTFPRTRQLLEGPKQQQQQQQSHSHSHDGPPPTNTNNCFLLQLPDDIIVSGIAPYLRAKSLDALRCSCTVLHHMMRVVVPGMKLDLYTHQIKSLSWMRLRETCQWEEIDFLSSSSSSYEEEEGGIPATTTTTTTRTTNKDGRHHFRKKILLPQEDGDGHRAVTGGATVLLRPRRYSSTTDNQTATTITLIPSVRIAQDTGVEMTESLISRKMARGAILCDSPGLGKTITVLSLILQTLGLSTATASSSSSSPSSSSSSSSNGYIKNNNRSNEETGNSAAQDNSSPVDDEDNTNNDQNMSKERIFTEYWKEQVVAEFRRPALLRLVSDLIKSHKLSGYFIDPVNASAEGCENYYDIIKDPICMKDIRKTIESDGYGELFSLFVADVERCFRNATVYNPPEHFVHQTALRMSATFRTLVEEFKAKHIQVAQKSFAKSSSKPNSVVAALIEDENRKRVLESLVPSSGTLIVVPGVLMEHWKDQLRQHVDLSYCTTKIPIIFEYDGLASSGLQMEEIVIQCKVKHTHFPFALLDLTNTKKLPSPEFLAMFSIVITTNQRFTHEWKNGSFEEELKRKSTKYDDEYEFRESLRISEQSCPLLKINWLRMIVDEGHSMGRGKGSAIRFASWITAERRWAMTGTPTRQTATESGLSNILGLMNYLQHDFFSHRRDGLTTWQNLISRSWNAEYLASFCRLKSLLKLFMVRHTKKDIAELPPPQYCTTVLNMSSEEVTTYNTLVCAVQSNLLITSMEGETSGAQDSLLHQSQAKHAKNALSNVRLVCAGGTRVVPTLSGRHWDEFLTLLKESNVSEDKYVEAQHYLHRATTEQLSPCACCGMMLSTLLVFPCGDLVCTECVDNKSTSCIVCDKEFNVDDFQRLQPGLAYNWLHNIEEEQKKKKNAAQSSFNSPNNQAMSISNDHADIPEGGGGNLAPRNPENPRRRTRKHGDGHTCEFDPKSINGECTLCWTEHDSCNLMNKNARCGVCYRIAEACPQSESKSYYIIDRLVKLHERQQRQLERNQAENPWMVKWRSLNLEIVEQPRPVKVIIFSQFRKVLNMVGDRLLRRLGTACVAEYWGAYRKQELHKFVHDNECFCMLLGKDGSEGLDLSFVTHIIFLEQVWDKSLEHQVVARAWRMGAKGAVEVETLIAENSVEETMRRLERANAAEDSLEEEPSMEITEDDDNDYVQDGHAEDEDDKNPEYRRAKLHFLLKRLQLIKNTYTLSFGAGTKRNAWQFSDNASTSAPDTPVYTIQPSHLVSPMKRPKVGGRAVRFEMDPHLA